MLAAELFPGPGSGHPGRKAEGVVGVREGAGPVVIPADHHLRFQELDAVEHLVRLGAIPDQVAQQDETVDGPPASVPQHDPEGVQIGVDVRKNEVHLGT